MDEQTFEEMIDQLLKSTLNNEMVEVDYEEQVEIRDALEADLRQLKNDLHERHWEWARLNRHNSNEEEIEEAKKKVVDLKNRIGLREEGLNKFYNRLIEMLK